MKKERADRWVRRWEVLSRTHPNQKPYTVAVDRSNNWGCSCGLWVFQRKTLPTGECHHIEEVKERIAAPRIVHRIVDSSEMATCPNGHRLCIKPSCHLKPPAHPPREELSIREIRGIGL